MIASVSYFFGRGTAAVHVSWITSTSANIRVHLCDARRSARAQPTILLNSTIRI